MHTHLVVGCEIYSQVIHVTIIVSIGYKRPTLGDVYKHVVPEYAHKWKYLGALLHFDQAELEIIFSNFRNDSEECCRSLLSRWLQKNPDASWDQMFLAIDDLSQLLLSEITYQGMNQITSFLGVQNK